MWLPLWLPFSTGNAILNGLVGTCNDLHLDHLVATFWTLQNIKFFIGSLRHCSPPLQVEPLEQGQRLLKEVWTWDFSWHWEMAFHHALWPSPIHDGTLLNQSGRCNSGTLRLCPLTLIIKKRRHFNLTNKYNYIYVRIYLYIIYIYIYYIYKYVYIYII